MLNISTLQKRSNSVLKHCVPNTSFYLFNIRNLLLIFILLFLSPAISHGQTENTTDTSVKNLKSVITDLKSRLPKAATDSTSNNQEVIKDKAKAHRTASLIVVFALGFVCLAVCFFLVYITNTSPRDGKAALGLPEGSVRALIALLALILYILVSVALTFSDDPNPSVLATDVTKTLGNLVIAISAFYFGSKTAEQATNAANNKSNAINAVSPTVIQSAILANKDNWITVYGCTNVMAGKKSTDDTTHDIDCIVFKVVDKNIIPPGAKPIPPTITYTSGGKDYVIPTDVQVG